MLNSVAVTVSSHGMIDQASQLEEVAAMLQAEEATPATKESRQEMIEAVKRTHQISRLVRSKGLQVSRNYC